MANPLGPGGFGFLGYVQWAREATWSTFPTITRRTPFIKANAKAMAGRIRPKTMDGSLAIPGLVAGMQMVEFDLTLPLTYSNQLLFWDGIMGTATYGSNGGATTGSNPYTHTFAQFLTLQNSYAFEIIHGQMPFTAAKCMRVKGAKIAKATIKMSGGVEIQEQMGTLELKMIGHSLTENETITGSLGSSSTQDYVLASHLAVNTDPAFTATSAHTEELEIAIDCMTKERAFLEGSGYVSEPQRSGRPKVTATSTIQFQSRSALNVFLANTKGATQYKWSNGASKDIQIDFYGGIPTFPEIPIEDEGWIKQKLVVEGEDSGVGDTLAVTIINAQSSITA